MTGPSRAALPGLLLLALVLSACGGSEDAGSAPSRTAPASSSPAGGSSTDDGGGDAAPSPADTEPDTGQPSGDALVSVTDVRIGRHDGFDRVVVETGGTGTPGWDVRYVDAAQSQGSGDEIDVDGDAVLQVTITGVGYPFDTGVEEYAGPDRLSARDAEAVTEVVYDSTFEGTAVAFAGVTEDTPFRVYLLEDPARVVLEVADPA